MNNEHEEQTRWLVDYLETRFSRIEDGLRHTTSHLQVRLDSVAEGLEDRLDRAIDKVDQAILAQSEALNKVEERVTQVEVKQTRLDGQAGFLKNIPALSRSVGPPG